MVEWILFDRIKLISKRIIIYREKEFPTRYKVVCWNHDSKNEKEFLTLDEAKNFIDEIGKFVFYKGKFITRKEMAYLSNFKQEGYPEWFKKKIMRELIEKKKSLSYMARKYNLANMTLMMWLKNDGHKYIRKYGNSTKFGNWV